MFTFSIYRLRYVINSCLWQMAYNYRKQPRGFATKAIHAGQDPAQWTNRDVITPICMSISFKHDSPGVFHDFEYSRIQNPTRQVLERCLASLDNAKHGLVFSSGMGATSTILNMLSAGDHLLMGDEIYGGSISVASNILGTKVIEMTLVDTSNLEALRAAIKPNTKMLFFETPTNPTMKISDIEAVCKICHEHKNIIVVVDNTFMTSYFQRPLELGADIVCYSLTKFMNGHVDILMGALTTSSDELNNRLQYIQKITGALPSPFDCYQVIRSLKTLPMRMDKHMHNSIILGKSIENHAFIEKIMHPGLTSHPQHEMATKQSYGYSGMFAFYLKGNIKHANAFFKTLKIFTLGGSLGGLDSLIALPTIMTHARLPAEQKESMGITDSLIRVSVGAEDVEDLIDDFTNALNAAQSLPL